MRLFKAAIIIAIMASLLSCKQNSNDSKVIASSSLSQVLFSDFEYQMLNSEFQGDKQKASASKIEQRERFLNSMLMEGIINDLAIKNKLDTLDVVKSNYHSKLYYDAIINHLIVDSIQNKIFGEDDIKATYEKKKIKYLPKHILIATNNKRNLQKAKVKIDSIYNELISGGEFSKLAEKYSDDVKTGREGGELGWLNSYDLLEEFETEMLKLNKGEISKPFTTKYGYHIILLADKKENKDLKSYNEEKSTITKELSQKYSNRSSALSQIFLDNILNRLNVKIDTLSIKTLVKQYSKNEKEFKGTKLDPTSKFAADDRKKVLASFKNEIVDIDTLLVMLSSVPMEKRPPINNLNQVIDVLKNILKVKLLEEYADQLGYTKKIELIKKAKQSMTPIYREALINMIKAKVEVTESEINEFYKENKEKYKNAEGYDPVEKVKISIKNAIQSRKMGKNVKEWENDLLKEYKVHINKVLLEETFYYITDDKK